MRIELIECSSTQKQCMDYLPEQSQHRFRLPYLAPKSSKEAATEAARLRGVSFSAFVRPRIINELSKGE